MEGASRFALFTILRIEIWGWSSSGFVIRAEGCKTWSTKYFLQSKHAVMQVQYVEVKTMSDVQVSDAYSRRTKWGHLRDAAKPLKSNTEFI